MKNEALLKVTDLTIGFPKEGRLTPVVDHISFTVGPGEILGIVGESGSGKSMTALAVMNLLPETASVTDGTILYNNMDLIHAPEKELRELKGSQLAMIFQEPMTSLNPVMTVGMQVEEMLRLHEKLPEIQYREKTVAALLDAGLEDAEAFYHRYPHELSGGMRQRAMIAMAMIAGPKLLIADEPTTALDVTIQDKILLLLKKINRTCGTSIILVSHDLGVIKSICNRTLVMKDGRIVESGDASEIFEHPQMDYTKELAAAAPANWMKRKLQEGESVLAEPEDKGKNREAAVKDEDSLKNNPVDNTNTDTKKKNIRNENIIKENFTKECIVKDNITKEQDILQVENLSVSYIQRTGKLFGKKQRKQVVKNASLYLKKGEILGIVGESGCGKTTLAKAIAGLIKGADGTIRLSHRSNHENNSGRAAGTKASAAEYKAETGAVLSRPQMVFQDPYSSLNPARKVGWILEEPLKLHRGFSKIKRKARVKEVIQQVGLQEEHLGRFVSQLSGGQRQRVAIAAALILKPELIILDEPVSALDVTVQAQILDLLKMLQQKFDLSYLFISHDLNVIYKVCDRVCVMYQGEIIETGNTRDIFFHPSNEYTKELLKASLPG